MALINDFIYLGMLVCCIMFGVQLRKFENPRVRRNVATGLGVAVVFALCGLHIIHPVFMILVNAAIVLRGNPRWLHWASFTFSFTYLVFCRSLQYLGLPEIPEYLNAIVMLLTLRVVGLAFDRHRFEVERRRQGAEFKPPHPLPGFLDICHYAFCYIGVLTGPFFRYSTYYDMLHAPHSVRAPCWNATLERLKYVPVYLVLFFLSGYVFPVSYVETEEFAGRSWFYRFVYSNAVFFTFRMRMYSAFIISECVCISAGLGAYPKRLKAQSGAGPTAEDSGCGNDEVEEYDFETVKNIDAYGSDFAPTVREGMRWWNMTVQYWLAVNVYKSMAGVSKPVRVAATMLCSSVWHGVYAGYYLSMLTVPFIMVVEDLFERRVRRRLDESVSVSTGVLLTWKAVYDWISLVLKMQWFGYMSMAFLLLRVDKTLTYWRSVYFAGHVLIAVLFVIGNFAIPKPPRSAVDEDIKRGKDDVRKAGKPINVDDIKSSAVKQLKQAAAQD